jgi:hypothetical protein
LKKLVCNCWKWEEKIISSKLKKKEFPKWDVGIMVTGDTVVLMEYFFRNGRDFHSLLEWTHTLAIDSEKEICGAIL